MFSPVNNLPDREADTDRLSEVTAELQPPPERHAAQNDALSERIPGGAGVMMTSTPKSAGALADECCVVPIGPVICSPPRRCVF